MTWNREKFGPPYQANHMRLRSRRGKADAHLCDGCCGSRAKDWALIHEQDGADPMNYVPLCRPCHFAYDREGVMAGAAKRKADPVWQAKRKLLVRDELGRYTKP